MPTTKKSIDSPLETLREPFDEDIKTENDGFTTVPPIHYVSKLVDSGVVYNLRQSVPALLIHGDAAAIVVVTSVDFEGQTVEGVGATAADSSDESQELAKNAKSAASDSLKRALLNLGVNREAYQKDEAEEKPERKSRTTRTSKPSRDEEQTDDSDGDDGDDEKPAKRSSRSTSSNRSSGRSSGSSKRSSSKTWDGSEVIGFGKHEGVAWQDVPGAYLSFIVDKMDEGSPVVTKAEKEIERRGDDYDPEEGNDKPKPRSSNRRSGGKGRAGRFD